MSILEKKTSVDFSLFLPFWTDKHNNHFVNNRQVTLERVAALFSFRDYCHIIVSDTQVIRQVSVHLCNGGKRVGCADGQTF